MFDFEIFQRAMLFSVVFFFLLGLVCYIAFSIMEHIEEKQAQKEYEKRTAKRLTR